MWFYLKQLPFSIIAINIEPKNYKKVLDFIYQQTNELRVGKKENGESFSTFSVSVPRPVILVFKTDSNQTIITN